jgi:hypothetical protein
MLHPWSRGARTCREDGCALLTLPMFGAEGERAFFDAFDLFFLAFEECASSLDVVLHSGFRTDQKTKESTKALLPGSFFGGMTKHSFALERTLRLAIEGRVSQLFSFMMENEENAKGKTKRWKQRKK